MEARETVVRVVARDTVLVPDSVSWDAETQCFVPARYDTIPAWQLDQRLGGLVVTSWVDEDGRSDPAESPLGMTLERTAFELARQEWRAAGEDAALAAGYGAIIEATAIASNVALGCCRGAATGCAVRLRGVALEGFDLVGRAADARGATRSTSTREDCRLDSRLRAAVRGGGEAAARS